MIGDDHVMLNDYAPRGAIAQGARIVATGGSAGAPCASCHGAGLRGTDHIPPIAGRPAGYVARTLWDIRVGARRNLEAAPMLGIARTLAPADIRDVSAYLASLRR
jgi:cytochrome c553